MKIQVFTHIFLDIQVIEAHIKERSSPVVPYCGISALNTKWWKVLSYMKWHVTMCTMLNMHFTNQKKIPHIWRSQLCISTGTAAQSVTRRLLWYLGYNLGTYYSGTWHTSYSGKLPHNTYMSLTTDEFRDPTVLGDGWSYSLSER